MKTEPTTAWSEFWITIVGPVTNLVLAGVFALLGLVLTGNSPLAGLVKYLAYINLILGVFNLIPGYPLDGGGVLMSIIWGITHKRHWGVVAAAAIGSVVAYLLITIGVIQVVGGNIFNGIWTTFIGWFLLNASGGAARQERLKELLSGHLVSEAMSNNYTIVYADTLLQTLVDEHILGSGRRIFMVKKGDQIVGMLTMHALQTVSKDRWSFDTVEQVMIPLADLKTVQPSTELFEAIQAMDSHGVNQLPVLVDGQVQGILTREDVISHLRRLQSIQAGRSIS
jgi:CBS domain-containing protein